MPDLHAKAMLAQDFARLVLFHLDRPDDEFLEAMMRNAEIALRQAWDREATSNDAE